MNVYVLNRRSIVFRTSGPGMVHVLLVPGREQIQVIRDIIGVTDVPSHEAGKGRNMPSLSRARLGMRYIYGYLVEDIAELKQSVRVWLAEDFVDDSCKAFFFVFSPDVVIHGVREADDEGQRTWRVAQLPGGGEDGYTTLINAVSDYVISQSTEGLVVAVYNQFDLYKRLQDDLRPYDITPIPFTTLKPAPNIKPLYRHYDFTLAYVTILLFGTIAFMASAGYLVYTLLSRNKLDAEIERVQTEIREIQLNQNISQIRDPQSVLQAMSKAGEVEPSAVINAAASVAEPFGTLTNVTYQPPVLKEGDPQPDTQTVTLAINGIKDKLLLDQENKAKSVLGDNPWVRSVQRVGSVGADGQLEVTLQVGGVQTSETSVSPVSETTPMVSPTSMAVSGSMQPVTAVSPTRTGGKS